MKQLLIFVALIATVLSQDDDVSKNIRDVFPTPSTDFLSELGEVVSQKPMESFGAVEKCGEGSDQGIHVCVPYYNCDGKTRTIIQTGETDGFGVIDIRFGEQSPCKHPLDICCKIPEKGVPPKVTTQPPIINPTDPTITSTIPPVKPGRGDYCGIRNPKGIDFQITGASDNEAEYGEFPWMLEILEKSNDNALCGASLITPTAVLTAAHCVHKFKTSDIKIRAGEWDTQTTRERVPYQERDISTIIIHNDFNAQTVYNNVALLVLSQPLVKADNLGTICLPPQGLKFNAKDCFATGWGKDKFGKEGQFQVILKKIQLPIVQNPQCQDALRTTRLGKFFSLHESFICAGGESGKDTCTGDGGSPLVCPDPKNPGRYVQAGIVSWGIGCGEKNIPGVYTDVSRYRSWVDEQMDRLNLETIPYVV